MVSYLSYFNLWPLLLFPHVRLVWTLGYLNPWVQQYIVGSILNSQSLPVIDFPLHCWCCIQFSVMRVLVAVNVFTCSVRILLVASDILLMVLARCESTYFSAVVSMYRLSRDSEISSWIVMDLLYQWIPAWYEFMHWNSRRLWYYFAKNFLKLSHIFLMQDSCAKISWLHVKAHCWECVVSIVGDFGGCIACLMM